MISRRRLLSNSTIALVATSSGCAAANAQISTSTISSISSISSIGSTNSQARSGPGADSVFRHGVASGDPLGDRIILWTRIEASKDAMVPVRWWIAKDEAMQQVVNGGEVTALPWRDHCVKVDALGLEPARRYFYQFEAGGERSVVGRTRTLPAATVTNLKFAITSCSNYPFGYFNAYGRIAARDDLDAVLHLGDYIYEYAPGGYGDGAEFDRTPFPAREIVTLDDYRGRHAQYKTDPDLQAAHAAHPWITIWDDHETTNNSWRDGADNHNPDLGEGTWIDRRQAGERAYFEWMPIRETLGARGSFTYRSFRFGNLCDLIMLDTRLHGRSQQVVAAEKKNRSLLDAPGRTLLGADQHAWLAEELRASKANSTQWRVLGQQCMLGQLLDAERHILNTDQWDGYPHSRAALLEQLRNEVINDTVVLTGDIHSAWALDITPDPFKGYDPSSGKGSLAVELVATSVTSPGPFGSGDDAIAAEKRTLKNHPHLHWTNFRHRGYLMLDLNAERALAQWWAVDTITEHSDKESRIHAMLTQTGRNHLEVA